MVLAVGDYLKFTSGFTVFKNGAAAEGVGYTDKPLEAKIFDLDKSAVILQAGLAIAVTTVSLF
jgi:hypothetical protein